MNIQVYSAWKKSTNIKTNEYIRPNILEYIQISEYSSHAGGKPWFKGLARLAQSKEESRV